MSLLREEVQEAENGAGARAHKEDWHFSSIAASHSVPHASPRNVFWRVQAFPKPGKLLSLTIAGAPRGRRQNRNAPGQSQAKKENWLARSEGAASFL